MISLCSSLKYELSEIVSALQKAQSLAEDSPSPLRLYVAAPNHVFDTGSMVGRVRALCDSAWKWLTANSYHGTIEQAVEEIIHQLFDHTITEAYKARQRHLAHHIRLIESRLQLEVDEEARTAQKARYFTYISNELADAPVALEQLQTNFEVALTEKPLEAMELASLRCLVTQVSQAVKPFWYKMIHYRNTFAAPLQKYLPTYPIVLPTEKSIDWAVMDLDLYHALDKEQQWIDLEGMLSQAIPVFELIKICQSDKKLDLREKRILNKWIAALNQQIVAASENKKAEIIHLIKNALEEIVKITDIQGEFDLSVGLLVNKLEDYGCHLQELEDLEHKTWRDNLREGKSIVCKGVKYKIGKEIQPNALKEDDESDRYRIFKVQNHPELVLKVGDHPFALDISSHKFKRHFAIPPIEGAQKVLKTDKKQYSFSLLELQSAALEERPWTSKDWILTSEDEKVAWPLTAFLFCMNDWHEWTQGDLAGRLFLNKDNKLTISCGLERGSDNYLAAEEFCVEKAKDSNSQEISPFLLHYLLEVSDYSRHCMAQFYRKNVEIMLKTGEFDFFNLSLPRDFNDDHYKKRLRKLENSAKKLRKKCLNEVSAYMREKKLTGASSGEKQETSTERALRLTQSWKHFTDEKGNLIKAIKENSSELNHMRKEIQASKKSSQIDALSKKIEVKNCKRLQAVKEALKHTEAMLEAKILKTTVYDRLLSAYFSFAPPAILPDVLADIVLESFKNPEFKISPNIPKNYYQEQQKILIAKLEYAHKMLSANAD